VVRGYAASKGHWSPASSLTALLRQTQREYEDRFCLYELIQNAYDAHPGDAEGEIAILLDGREGERGVLYVANGGQPFGRANFEAICELAQSNKAPDQSIGTRAWDSRACFSPSSGLGFQLAGDLLPDCAWFEHVRRVLLRVRSTGRIRDAVRRRRSRLASARSSTGSLTPRQTPLAPHPRRGPHVHRAGARRLVKHQQAGAAKHARVASAYVARHVVWRRGG